MISDICKNAETPEDHSKCPVLISDQNCQCSCHPNIAKVDLNKESKEQQKLQEDKEAELSAVAENVSNVR